MGYSIYVCEVMPPGVMEHAMMEMLRVCKRAVLLEPLTSIQSFLGKIYHKLFGFGVNVDCFSQSKISVDVTPFNFDYKNKAATILIDKCTT